MRRETKRVAAAVLISLAPLAPITVFDLRISQNVANGANRFGRFVADFGQLPGYLVVYFALVFILIARTTWVEKSCYAILLVLQVLVLFSDLSDYYSNRITGSLVLGLAVGCAAIAFRLRENSRVLQFSRVATLLTPLFLVQTIKWYWGRIRFHDLNADYSDFTPWYLPQGYTDNRSFPSGHAAMGWVLLALIVLASSRRQRILISTVVIVWGLLVSMGRVVAGAHYLSDVYVSTLLSVWVFVFLWGKTNSSASFFH